MINIKGFQEIIFMVTPTENLFKAVLGENVL